MTHWLVFAKILSRCFFSSCWLLLTHKFLIFQDIEYIRSHYNIEDFINFNYHQQEEHGHLCHFVLNPVFHHYTKYFLKEILRLGHKSSLYYPIYPEYVEGKVRRVWLVFLILNIAIFSHFIFSLHPWMTANRDFLVNLQQTVPSFLPAWHILNLWTQLLHSRADPWCPLVSSGSVVGSRVALAPCPAQG